MIRSMDSTLSALDSELVFGQELLIDAVANQNYIDLTNMNNGFWDNVKNIWIGQNHKEKISLSQMMYKRHWYSGTAEPEYWTTLGRQLMFETDCTSAYDNVVIDYHKKTRPRLESFSDTFTANATTDVITLTSGNPNLVTGDGPFTVSNSGGALPTGLAASTNYWVIFDPSDTDGLRLATSKAYALGEKEYREGYTLVVGLTYKILERTTLDFTSYGATANTVGTYFTCSAAGTLGSEDRVLQTNSIDVTATGSGTHTITFSSDMMPYDGIYDDLFREMLVLHAKGKKEGQLGDVDQLYQQVFMKRATEETIRKGFVPTPYYIDF